MASLDGHLEESFLTRWWHRLRVLGRPRLRNTTALEYDLTAQLQDARRELARSRSLLHDLETEVKQLKSSLQIAGIEVIKLTHVCERDLQRVKSESAALIRAGGDKLPPS